MINVSFGLPIHNEYDVGFLYFLTTLSSFMKRWQWLLVSLASAFVAMTMVCLAFLLPFWPATILLVVGVIVFVFVLFRHPKYWQRRLASSVVGVWLASCVTTGINASVQFGEEGFGYWVIDNLAWPFHLVVALLVETILILDYLSIVADSHGRVEQAVDLPAATTENERLISNVPRNRREGLVLQTLQEKSEFFSVDTRDLTQKQKHDVVRMQLDSRERLAEIKVAEERLRASSTRWVIVSVLVVIAVVVTGAVFSNRTKLQIQHIDFVEDPEHSRVEEVEVEVQIVNSGNRVALIGEAVFYIEKVGVIKPTEQLSPLEITHTHDVDLKLTQKKYSFVHRLNPPHLVRPNDADRFSFRLGIDPSENYGIVSYVFQLKLSLIFNNGVQTSPSDPVLFLIQPFRMGGWTEMPIKERQQAMMDNWQVLKPLSDLKYVKDDKLRAIIQDYELRTPDWPPFAQ